MKNEGFLLVKLCETRLGRSFGLLFYSDINCNFSKFDYSPILSMYKTSKPLMMRPVHLLWFFKANLSLRYAHSLATKSHQ